MVLGFFTLSRRRNEYSRPLLISGSPEVRLYVKICCKTDTGQSCEGDNNTAKTSAMTVLTASSVCSLHVCVLVKLLTRSSLPGHITNNWPSEYQSQHGPGQTHPNHSLVVKGILTALWKIFNAPQGPCSAIIIIRQTLTFSKTLPQSLARSHKNTQCISQSIRKADNNKGQSIEGGETERVREGAEGGFWWVRHSRSHVLT